MRGVVRSAFLYVNDVRRSVEFYQDVFQASLRRIVRDELAPDGAELALLDIGDFVLMLHPQSPHADEFDNARVGLGIHLQMRVDDIRAFHDHCVERGAMLALSGDPVEQDWGWTELAVRDPDGYLWTVYQDETDGFWV